MDKKEFVSGLVLIGIGGAFALSSLTSLELGTTFKMGPGYFPLVLASLVLVIGCAVLVMSFQGSGGLSFTTASKRSMLAIIVAPIVFGLIVRGAGFIPAVAATTLSASMATTELPPLKILAVTVAMTAFCVAVFIFGLGLPVRLIGPWLGA